MALQAILKRNYKKFRIYFFMQQRVPSRWLAICLALLVTMAWAGTGAGAEGEPAVTVTVGVDHSPPYRIVDNGQRSGLYLDIFNELAERLGWQVAYERVPFRRILLLMREGDVDVMLGPVQTDNRQEYMTYVAPAFPPERRLFFFLDEDHRIDGYGDLQGKRVGVLEGARYFRRFDRDASLHKVPAPRYENLMKMLEKQRVDVVIAPEMAGLRAAAALDARPRVSPFFVPGEPAWIAVSNGSPLLNHTDEMLSAYESMEQDGVIESLMLKYLARPVP